ncbi:MAG: hypothetical protein HY553_07625 [Elusimicrobia bacterium]|nr:hypothetical protein [Elusimicrobiota bacterium]
MDAKGALAFVKRHGVVLVSAKGPVPTLTHAIAGAEIRGSWWGHPAGKKIFFTLEAVTDSPDVLVCRLIGGKLTLVHRRLWPALARAAPLLGTTRLARVIQEHTASGKHVNRVIPYAKWVTAATRRAAAAFSEKDALAAVLGPRVDDASRKGARRL